jgi:hypothetical protein
VQTPAGVTADPTTPLHSALSQSAAARMMMTRRKLQVRQPADPSLYSRALPPRERGTTTLHSLSGAQTKSDQSERAGRAARAAGVVGPSVPPCATAGQVLGQDDVQKGGKVKSDL